MFDRRWRQLFDDLSRHPWFFAFALAGVVAFFMYMYYSFKNHDDEMEVQYGIADLLMRIYEKVS